MAAWVGSAESPFLGCRLPTSHSILTWWRGGERDREVEAETFCDSYEDTYLIQESLTLVTSSKPNYLPKAQPPDTITLSIRALTCEF